MLIFKKTDQLSAYIQQQKKAAKTIGFVPTMGALHEGHLSLINLSKKENGLTVSSIFVNPTQFNNASDFQHYPNTIEEDIAQLIKAGCDILLLPSVAEIYPPGYQPEHYELGYIENILEGYYRPGHFQGVCQVMDKLLHIVQPDNLYLGQKDYQQCMVIKKLMALKFPEGTITLNIIPTKREEDGLAMSSRNLRLNKEERKKAVALFQALTYIKNNWPAKPTNDLQRHAAAQLEQAGFAVDYVTIADAGTLQPADTATQHLVALIAAAIGNVRLIDNMLLN